ncbi:MAG TPA: sigma-70 family RNA polymerase sigma factor [Pirellulales bacterium]|jgi:RNA polymerase sigma factor (sigma-70 family)
MLDTGFTTASVPLVADRELLTRFVESRDQQSFCALVERHGPLVWQVCSRLTRQRHDAEDAFQATFLTFTEKADRIRQANSVGSWLYGAAFRISMRLRRRYLRRRECALEREVVVDCERSATIADVYETEILYDELNHLPPKYRDPLVMRYLLEQSSAQICRALELSPTALKGRLQRARRELRARLKMRGVDRMPVAGLALEAIQSEQLPAALLAHVCQGTDIATAMHAVNVNSPASVSKIARPEIRRMINMIEVVSIAGCAAALAWGFPTRTTVSSALEDRVATVGLPVDATSVAAAQLPLPTAKEPAAGGNEPTVLAYGDGAPDGKKSIAGAGEMIRFAAPADNMLLTGIELHGARYGRPQAPTEDFKIYVLADDRKQILHTELAPYARFERGEAKWVELKFNKPVEVARSFWIVADFNAEATKGIYVSYDTSTGGEHSLVGLPSKDAKKPTFGGDWMIRAAVTQSAKSEQ